MRARLLDVKLQTSVLRFYTKFLLQEKDANSLTETMLRRFERGECGGIDITMGCCQFALGISGIRPYGP